MCTRQAVTSPRFEAGDQDRGKDGSQIYHTASGKQLMWGSLRMPGRAFQSAPSAGWGLTCSLWRTRRSLLISGSSWPRQPWPKAMLKQEVIRHPHQLGQKALGSTAQSRQTLATGAIKKTKLLLRKARLCKSSLGLLWSARSKATN